MVQHSNKKGKNLRMDTNLDTFKIRDFFFLGDQNGFWVNNWKKIICRV